MNGANDLVNMVMALRRFLQRHHIAVDDVSLVLRSKDEMTNARLDDAIIAATVGLTYPLQARTQLQLHGIKITWNVSGQKVETETKS